MIVLFHVFYLFGQYIYENYCKRLRALCDAAKESESSFGLQETYEMFNDNSHDYDDDDDKTLSGSKYHEIEPLKFQPPAYIQRYRAVCDVLDGPMYKGKIRKVVDFGCAEMGFLYILKNIEGVEEILCVDIDRQVLERYKTKAEPFLIEYLTPRKTPLVIEVCEGSITHNDQKLEQTDAVICIELIEHLYPDTLMDLPFNIFEYIMPKVAIVTTPNADFNVLFPNFSGYRHPDHKFEWTREQFQDWAQNIVVRYPSYSVTFHGICKGPAGTEELGTCSQMAVFHRLSSIEECSKIIGVDGLFKTVVRHDYPIHIDNRSDEEKLLHEATYHIIRLAYAQDDRDAGVILRDVLPYLEEKNFNVSVETLRKILEDANWIIKDQEDGPIVMVHSLSSHEDEDEEFDMDDADFMDEENINEFESSIDKISANADEQDLPGNSYTENWYEQPSIVIPENRSIIQENTYLFDGENFVSEYQPPEKPHVIDDNESLIYTERELPSNPISLSLNETKMDGRIEMIDAELPLVFDTSSTISNSSLTLKNSSVDNTTIDSALSQNRDINSATAELQVQKITLFNFQPYMSVSRSSTSPEPLFLSSELNNSLHNYSASYQNGSCDKFHNFSLNNTLHQSEIANEAAMNVEESTTEDILSLPSKQGFPEEDCIQLSEINSAILFSNYSKVNNSCNFEQMTSVKNQIYENNDMADMVPLNVSNSSVNNQPKFTSSPKASTKTSTNIIGQSCFELKELMPAVNRNILSCIKEATKETVSDTDSSSLNDISQKSSSSTTTETVQLCASSLSDDITNTSKYNVGLRLVSNNAQQHLCLENEELSKIVESTCDTDEKFVEKSVVINHESDVVDDVQSVDAHHSSSSDNENINDKEENVCCTLTKTNDDDTTMKAHQENVINDSAQSNVRKKSLSPPKELSSFKSQNNSECSSTECAKKTNVLENDRLISSNSSSSNKDTNNVQFASVLKKSDEIVGTSKDVNTSNIVGLVNNTEAKSASPFETPPNSWSPEIMDSGYPNSASVQDITPEYDLSSIAQDHIPDSESPSIAEAPRLGILEPIEVENGDLANNNRDDEGNNMMAVDADIENLQPLIDVLENDLENENDIYVMQNGFPMWLLRLLDMANPLDFDMQNLRDLEDEVADDANYVARDEGFDSSSSENESDI